jgi:hypothetical protein
MEKLTGKKVISNFFENAGELRFIVLERFSFSRMMQESNKY